MITETWNDINTQRGSEYSIKYHKLNEYVNKWVAIQELIIKIRDTGEMKLLNSVLN